MQRGVAPIASVANDPKRTRAELKFRSAQRSPAYTMESTRAGSAGSRLGSAHKSGATAN
jgi:hypothetical protein